MTVGGTQQETSHDGVIMCGAKGMGPDAIRWQAWSRVMPGISAGTWLRVAADQVDIMHV